MYIIAGYLSGTYWFWLQALLPREGKKQSKWHAIHWRSMLYIDIIFFAMKWVEYHY
jgi:hypothetical protein